MECGCGSSAVSRKHKNTYKHTTWEFQRLALEMLEITDRKQKVGKLIQMRTIIRTGRVR